LQEEEKEQQQRQGKASGETTQNVVHRIVRVIHQEKQPRHASPGRLGRVVPEHEVEAPEGDNEQA
jgi:hypothetical protein